MSTATDDAEQRGDVVTAEGEADNVGFLNDLGSAPCFRKSSLYAIGGGGSIAALRLMRNRDVMQAAETWIKTGCGIALLSWVMCRRQYYAEREMTYSSVEKIRKANAARGAARAKQMREEGPAKAAGASSER